jgi:uncharacterized phage protein (TIGR02220 family)
LSDKCRTNVGQKTAKSPHKIREDKVSKDIKENYIKEKVDKCQTNVRQVDFKKVESQIKEVTGKNISLSIMRNTTELRRRVDEGFTEEDILTVIEKAYKRYKGSQFYNAMMMPNKMFALEEFQTNLTWQEEEKEEVEYDFGGTK